MTFVVALVDSVASVDAVVGLELAVTLVVTCVDDIADVIVIVC